jgi:hypothetical protein
MFRWRVLVCALAVCAAVPAGATTFLPVTFDDLITRADLIFVGQVVDVRPFALETRDGTIIKTRVTFRVEDPLLGTSSALEVFDFLGGEVDGFEMTIAGMPTFSAGDRRVMFARRERSINPIVGFSQGLLRVTRDASGVDRVLAFDGQPLAGPESIGPRAPGVTLVPDGPMRLSDLRNRINRALVEARRK